MRVIVVIYLVIVSTIFILIKKLTYFSTFKINNLIVKV